MGRYVKAVGVVELTSEDYTRAYQAGVSQNTPFTLNPDGSQECPAGWRREDIWQGNWKQTWCHPPAPGSGTSFGAILKPLLFVAGVALVFGSYT